MNPDRRVIDDGQLDEALRTIAAAPVPADLPARVLSAIHEDVPPDWVRGWLPAVGVVVVVLLVMVGLWMHAPDTPREARGTGRTAQGPETAHLRTVAPSAPVTPDVPQEAEGSRHMAQGTGPTAQRTGAPSHPRTFAPAVAQDDEIDLLDPPEPLTVAPLLMTELSERALQVDALHIPALEIASLER